MAKIETIRFNGRTTSEVRKQYRHWYEDNWAKVSIVNEHEIERLRLETGGPQHRPLGREDAPIRCWSNTNTKPELLRAQIPQLMT